jgi:hypothetical protein
MIGSNLLAKALIKRSLLIFIVSAFLSSCASIFNSKSKDIAIFTSEKTLLTIESNEVIYNKNDTLIEHNLKAKRSEETLSLTLSSENSIKTVSVSPRKSSAYLLNFVPNSPFCIGNTIGILIDNRSPKRFTYPKNIYVDMEKEDNSFLPYKPLDTAYRAYQNIIKINALKMASFEAGGVEISYEKKTSSKFSTQLTATYIIPGIWDFENFKPRKLSGFQLSIEERLYWKETAPIGYYFAVDLNYLNSRYDFTDSFIAKNKYYTILYEDEFEVRKQTLSSNAKLGRQFFIKRFTIDLSIGAGLRFKEVKHLDKINPDGEIDTTIFLFRDIKDLNNRPGKYLAFSFPISARIGWLF